VFALLLQAVPDPTVDFSGFVKMLTDAAGSGQWKLVGIVICVGVVFALRHFASRLPGKVGAFFQTARGGALLALLGGVATTLAGVLVQPGQKVSLAILLNGFVLGVAAAGGWNVVRRLIWGDDAPAAYPAPPAPPAS